MRLRIPDLNVYRGKIKFGSGRNLGKLFSRAPGRKISAIFKPLWICTLLLALSLSFFAGKATEGFLADASLETQAELARIINGRRPSPFVQSPEKRVEVSFVPFNVAEKSVSESRSDPKAIDAFTLVGTLPQIGAWLNDGKATSLVLEKQDYNGYKLRLVDTGRVILTKGEEEFYLFLQLGGKTQRQGRSAATSRPDPSSNQGSAGIVLATETSAGSVTKEIIDKLLMDPYGELGKIRIIPDANGMKLLSADNGSLLSQLGMQVGDVLTGINDIPIKDMLSVGNAIASMLNSNQFNLGLMRDSKPMQLGYSIK